MPTVPGHPRSARSGTPSRTSATSVSASSTRSVTSNVAHASDSATTLPQRRQPLRQDFANCHLLKSPGPPPIKALPLPPSPPSPCRSNSPKPPRGRAASLAPGLGSSLSPDSRDLCEITEECAREGRNSWTSCGGGGGPGIRVSAPKEEQGVGSPVLQERDLAGMGGRY
jgi:hypothetical protein